MQVFFSGMRAEFSGLEAGDLRSKINRNKNPDLSKSFANTLVLLVVV